MSKHTPGPWTYQPARNYEGFSIAPRGTLPTLAAVQMPHGNPRLINITAFNFPGETEANARLIAAAPDLLAACKRAFALIDDEENNKQIVQMSGSFGLWGALLAAIEKAEGVKVE